MKQKSIFVCQNCGYQAAKWQGQCSECSEWNSLVEQVVERSEKNGRAAKVVVNEADFQSLYSVVQKPLDKKQRISTHIGEFDRVLGVSTLEDLTTSAGLVRGSVMMVAGEPGIGKSTLITQTIVNILINKLKIHASKPKVINALGVDGASQQSGFSHSTRSVRDNSADFDSVSAELKILYVNGEENASQIAERIERVYKKYSDEHEIKSRGGEGEKMWRERLLFLDTTDVDKICSTIEFLRPLFVVVDSIQTVKTGELSGTAGSFGQLKECTQRITETVKKLSTACVLIGHVNKEGSIAGPKVLEHIVDGVLELSGERTGEVRILRAIKNRFGATDEVGLFLIDENGLQELTNPSRIFLQAGDQNVPGSAIVCTLEGTRPLLIETQALVLDSQLAMPRRVAQGIPLSRMQVLTAVLQKHSRVPLGTSDVFVNVAGGFQIREPAADLGIALAMVSSQKNKALPKDMVFIGEVGLLGEIREVPFLKRRVKEAQRLGFSQIVSFQTHKHISQVIGQLFGGKQ